MKTALFSLCVFGFLGPLGLAGAQSLSIGPNGVSFSTGSAPNDVTFQLDQGGLRVGVNSPAPRPLAGTRTLNCAGRAVNVSGSGGRVTLLGRCPRVTVSGSGNTVQIEQAGTITVRGSGNTVTWRKALTGSRPALSLSGAGNRVSATGWVAAPPRPAPVATTPARTAVPTRPAATTPRPAASPTAPQTAQPLW